MKAYYNLHTVYFLQVSATHTVIFRKVHYKRQIHQNSTNVSESVQRCKILNLKNNTWFKIHLTRKPRAARASRPVEAKARDGQVD
jgi:hypothetical protein